MAEVASQASALLGCTTDVVVMPFAECCMDVDKPSDQVLAEQILLKRAMLPVGGQAVGSPASLVF